MTKKLSDEQIALLKKPLPEEAVKQHPTKTFLSSIKAIYVVERLNDVFGLGGWKATNEVVRETEKWVVVKSTFDAPEYGIVIPDIFGGNDNADLGDAYKGACTDALTKIGSYLYIGMDVYKGLNDKPGNKPDNKNGANLHNRTAITKNGQPLISNVQFKQLMERVRKGDVEAGAKAKAAFSFEATQLSTLNDALKQTA